MDKETFYQRLIQALLNSDFRLRAKDLSQEELLTDRDTLSASVRMSTKLAPFIIRALTDVPLPKGMTNLHPFFNQEAIQEQLNKVR